MEAPEGGCQSGPMGNGAGGGGWGPWAPGGALDFYSSGYGVMDNEGNLLGWAYYMLDGTQADAWDVETVRTGYAMQYCEPFANAVLCL